MSTHRSEVQAIIDSLDAAADAGVDLSAIAHVRTALVSLRDEPRAVSTHGATVEIPQGAGPRIGDISRFPEQDLVVMASADYDVIARSIGVALDAGVLRADDAERLDALMIADYVPADAEG